MYESLGFIQEFHSPLDSSFHYIFQKVRKKTVQKYRGNYSNQEKTLLPDGWYIHISMDCDQYKLSNYLKSESEIQNVILSLQRILLMVKHSQIRNSIRGNPYQHTTAIMH